MIIKNGIITRRDLLRKVAYGTLAMGFSPPVDAKKKMEKVRVILIRDENVIDKNGIINSNILQEMLDQGICRLFDEKDPPHAWKRLIKPSDIVGIKSNVWPYLPTPGELENAIFKRVINAGVPRKNVAIDDRGVLDNPVFKSSTALINVRPLRTHHWSGIGGCIKNYIMFVRNPWLYHEDSCANLAYIWSKPIIKGKTRLNILSLIQTQFYNRGPHHFDRRFVCDYKGLLIGREPVALDAVGARLLQLQRISYFGEDRPLDTTPKHIFVAEEKYKLGVSDLKRIEIIKIGFQKESLL